MTAERTPFRFVDGEGDGGVCHRIYEDGGWLVTWDHLPDVRSTVGASYVRNLIENREEVKNMSEVTIEFAKQLEREHRQASQLAADATTRRNEAVLQLLEQDVRQAEIARALGITPGRVSQLAERARAAREQPIAA